MGIRQLFQCYFLPDRQLLPNQQLISRTLLHFGLRFHALQVLLGTVELVLQGFEP